jgi:hypothetical protein
MGMGVGRSDNVYHFTNVDSLFITVSLSSVQEIYP